MIRINSKEDLYMVAQALGVRRDWHEPDEQDVTAKVFGESFDNAGFWPAEAYPELPADSLEMHVMLYKDDLPYAVVDLATLFSWAAW